MQNSFLVSSDAAPGNVIVKLVSKSESALAETELLAKDEKDPMNSGEHPWSLDQGNESMLLLFNHSSTIQAFHVVIDGGGVIWAKVYRLQPMQTTSIQLQALIDDQVKDDNGSMIPRGTVEGVVTWFTSGPGIGKGRLLISSQTAAMARSFSCFQYTIVTGGKAATQITDDVLVTSQDVYLAVANQNVASASSLSPPHCTGAPISGNIDNLTYSWASGNTSIATIYSGTGQDVYVNGVGAGKTSIIATLTDKYGCQQASPAYVTVQVPTSLKVLSDFIVPNGTGANDGCPGNVNPANYTYGIEVDVHYQVLDQQSPAQAIKDNTMVPHEHVLFSTGQVKDTDICPSRNSNCTHTTAADGTFHDVPYGACSDGSFSLGWAQDITLIVNGHSYPVRTNNVTVSSSGSGHGTITNNSDINATH